MNKIGYLLFFVIGLVLTPLASYAQKDIFEEEESAELFMEEYSDEFQEKFFEALKQKGIENYDRAINLLLECKALGVNNSVLDYELAKAYLASKNYHMAQEYAIAALNSKPEDYWVLNTAITILARQGLNLENIKQQLPSTNIELNKNLVQIYYKQQNYEAALKVLEKIEPSPFTKEFTLKIEDSIRNKQEKLKDIPVEVNEQIIEASPIDTYLKTLTDLVVKANYKELQIKSLEALENFPAQPYFYYTYGLALNKAGNYKDAVPILETGIDFILDDVGLESKIYKELANAYTALGNSSKANMYLSKIKPGS